MRERLHQWADHCYVLQNLHAWQSCHLLQEQCEGNVLHQTRSGWSFQQRKWREPERKANPLLAKVLLLRRLPNFVEPQVQYCIQDPFPKQWRWQKWNHRANARHYLHVHFEEWTSWALRTFPSNCWEHQEKIIGEKTKIHALKEHQLKEIWWKIEK